MSDCTLTAHTELDRLAMFLRRYVIRTGGTHGMIKAAAAHFRRSRSRIRGRMRHINAEQLSRLETEEFETEPST